MTTKTRRAILVGEGVLTWLRSERVSDRYGAVYLMAEGDTSLTHGHREPLPTLHIPTGAQGRLVAEVIAIRDSTHIGDLFRGLVPRRPKVGQRITLGTGTVFSERSENITVIGLTPSTPRDSDWLNPRALYDAHEQTVRLWFHPGKPKARDGILVR